MHGFTGPVLANMESGLARHGVHTLHGTARFTGAEHLIDSAGFLYLEHLPSRILFVGGGLISFEFAHIAARAGSHVMIVDRGSRPLRGFDPDLVELLVTRSADIGIDLHRGTEIVAVHANGDGYDVTIDHLGQ